MTAMTCRRVLCGLLLASAVLACFAGWLIIANAGNAGKVTRARFEQVKQGMSREEVIRTVGESPRMYVEGLEYWSCDDGWLLVEFDAYDVATYANVGHLSLRPQEVPAEPPTLTERIRRWLGL
jgi:hypothetical protein